MNYLVAKKEIEKAVERVAEAPTYALQQRLMFTLVLALTASMTLLLEELERKQNGTD